MTEKDQSEPSRVDTNEGSLRRLSTIVRALPESELLSLLARLGIRIDPAKRLDVPSQAARALVGMPEVRDPSRLAAPSHELLIRIADAGGILHVDAKPPGLEPLMGRGVLFARRDRKRIELVLPHAFLLQIPSWSTEDPRSLRALISQASFETTSAIAAHYLGRPCTPPIALALEPAWDVLSNESALQTEIDLLAHAERKLLEAIEALGGEVETAELLDLEREPIRLRSAKGVSTTRRGAGFALERRAFLIPVHPNRHIVPSEVARIVGASRRNQLAERRSGVRARLESADHLPRRAQFAKDPTPLALAAALWIREAATQRDSSADFKPTIGIPRSLISRIAQSVGRPTHHVSFIAVLARAIGLFESSSIQTSSPCGALSLSEVHERIFRAWLNGAVWDEARAEPEVLRAAEGRREPSPTRAVRDAILEALAELPSDRWLPYPELEEYVKNDPRIDAAMHLLRRWAERQSTEASPVEVMPLTKIIVSVVLGSLTQLGVLDTGIDGDAVEAFSLDFDRDPRSLVEAPEPMLREQLSSVLVRQNERTRHLLPAAVVARPERKPSEPSTGSFGERLQLTVGPAALVGQVLSLASILEVSRADTELELLVSPAAIGRAIARGVTPEEMRERISALAPLPAELSELLTQASVVVGKGALVAVSAFLWVDNPDVRELLRAARTTAEFFLDPSPPGGLLVAPGVDYERLCRRCRGLGVEIEVAPDLALRASRGSSRAFTPLPQRASDAAVKQADAPEAATPEEGSSRSGTRSVRRASVTLRETTRVK
jgi:hypothetical protein